MRADAFFREVYRNCLSGTTRAALYFILSTLLVGAIVVTESLIVANLVDKAEEFRYSGAAVTVVAAEGQIDGRSCENLNNVSGVVAAGALAEEPDLLFTLLPDSPSKHYRVSPSFPRILEPDQLGVGVYVPRDVYDLLGGGKISTTDGTAAIAGVYEYPSDGRRPGLGWAIVDPSPADAVYDECWLLSWPMRADVRRLLLTSVNVAAQADTSSSAEIMQLNSRHGETFDGVVAYANRPTSLAPLVTFVVGGFIGFCALTLRRVELASNMNAGAKKSTLVLIGCTETTLWAVPSACMIAFVGTGMARFLAPAELVPMSLRALQLSTSLILGALIGAGTAVACVRKERLWRYVKAR